MNKNLKFYILCIALSSISLLTLLPYFDNFENSLEDKRFLRKYSTTDREYSIDDIILIDIDNRSIKELGNYHRWKRDYWTKTVDVLSRKGLNLLAFDILFDKSPDTLEDSVFAESIKQSDFSILSYNFSEPDSEFFLYPDTLPRQDLNLNSGAFIDSTFKTAKADILDFGSDTFHNSATGSGFANMEPDPDGVVRKTRLFYRYFDKLYPSLAFKTCLLKLQIQPDGIIFNSGKNIILKNALTKNGRKDLTIPLTKNNELIIHYQGPAFAFRTFSFYDIMANRVGGKKSIQNKIGLIGSSYRGLMDLRSTPVQQNFPGVAIHASIINTILSENFVTKPDKYTTAYLMLFAIVFISLFFLGRIKTIYSAIAVIAYAIGYIWLTFYLFDTKTIILDQFHVLAAMITTSLFAYLIKFFIEEKDKRLIKNTLGKYVPEVVSNAMLKDSSKLKLGGERKEISMFFSDIRDFTKISEQVSPEILVKFLNIYLSRMTKIIKDNQGTLDKFMGDAIICFFGAPLENDHPYYACKTALEIIRELDRMRPTMIHDAFRNIHIGIGINSGEVTVGNIGSMELFDYTAIGDNMNLASRLEGLNKYYGTSILISGETQNKIKERFITREIDTVNVKGRTQPVTLFELISHIENNQEENLELLSNINTFNNALSLYRKGDFLNAENIFCKYLTFDPDDKPALLLKNRCVEFQSNHPSNWNGVWQMLDK